MFPPSSFVLCAWRKSHCGLQMRRQALGYNSTCVLKAWNWPSRDCYPSSPGCWEARNGPRGLDLDMGCCLSTGQNCLAFTRNQPLTLASLPGAQNEKGKFTTTEFGSWGGVWYMDLHFPRKGGDCYHFQ